MFLDLLRIRLNDLKGRYSSASMGGRAGEQPSAIKNRPIG
jgi:hypothetical protein